MELEELYAMEVEEQKLKLWKIENNYLTAEENAKKLEEHINMDISKFKVKEFQTYHQQLQEFYNYQQLEIPVNLQPTKKTTPVGRKNTPEQQAERHRKWGENFAKNLYCKNSTQNKNGETPVLPKSKIQCNFYARKEETTRKHEETCKHSK